MTIKEVFDTLCAIPQVASKPINLIYKNSDTKHFPMVIYGLGSDSLVPATGIYITWKMQETGVIKNDPDKEFVFGEYKISKIEEKNKEIFFFLE